MIPVVGHLLSVLVLPRGHLTDLFVPTPGNLPFKKIEMLMPGGGGPGGMGAGGID